MKLLAKTAIGKSFQLVCGAPITMYLFMSLGKSPTNFHPNILVYINLDIIY